MGVNDGVGFLLFFFFFNNISKSRRVGPSLPDNSFFIFFFPLPPIITAFSFTRFYTFPVGGIYNNAVLTLLKRTAFKPAPYNAPGQIFLHIFFFFFKTVVFLRPCAQSYRNECSDHRCRVCYDTRELTHVPVII